MRFSIGATFALFWPTFRKSLGQILLTGLILYFASTALTLLVNLLLFRGPPSPASHPAGYFIRAVFTYFTMAVHGCSIIEIVLARIADRPVTLGAVLRKGLVWAVPALIVCLLWLLGAVIGWVLLLVPALIFASVFAVPLPALMADKAGILGAFTRARALTKGHRWSVFGLSLIVNLSSGFLVGAVLTILGLSVANSGTGLPEMLKGKPAEALVAIAILLAVVLVFYILMLVPLVMNVCLYATLRSDKGEPLTGNVAKVFE